jgi:hypothetical protein
MEGKNDLANIFACPIITFPNLTGSITITTGNGFVNG